MMPRSSSARARLTSADIAFVESVLVEELASPLRSLHQDDEAMTSILDLEAVSQAVIENPEISLPLHLYVLVRRAFVNSGVEEARVADQVAGELVEQLGITEGVRAFHFVCLIRRLPDGARFHIQAAAGESFLVLNGDFRVTPELLANESTDAHAGEGRDGDRDAFFPGSQRCVF
jgi:hypothetical protein